MNTLPHHLAAIAAALWVGGSWVVGYLAVPILFHAQPDRQLAGMLAGEMFTAMGYVGIVCAVYLLLHRGWALGKTALREPLFRLAGLMLLLGLAMQFGIQPLMAELKAQALPLEVMQSPLADRFKMWHGISSTLYLIQSLLGILLLIQVFRGHSGSDKPKGA